MIDQVQTTRLANGLTHFDRHMPGLRSLAWNLVRCGSPARNAGSERIFPFHRTRFI